MVMAETVLFYCCLLFVSEALGELIPIYIDANTLLWEMTRWWRACAVIVADAIVVDPICSQTVTWYLMLLKSLLLLMTNSTIDGIDIQWWWHYNRPW